MTPAYIAALLAAVAYAAALRVRLATLRSRLDGERAARRDAEADADRMSGALRYQLALHAGADHAQACADAREHVTFRRYEREMGHQDV